jgi:hypothetical protein
VNSRKVVVWGDVFLKHPVVSEAGSVDMAYYATRPLHSSDTRTRFLWKRGTFSASKYRDISVKIF